MDCWKLLLDSAVTVVVIIPGCIMASDESSFLTSLGTIYELVLNSYKLDIKDIIFSIKPRHSYSFELYFFDSK
jgi:hypothetical protein